MSRAARHLYRGCRRHSRLLVWIWSVVFPACVLVHTQPPHIRAPAYLVSPALRPVLHTLGTVAGLSHHDRTGNIRACPCRIGRIADPTNHGVQRLSRTPSVTGRHRAAAPASSSSAVGDIAGRSGGSLVPSSVTRPGR